MTLQPGDMPPATATAAQSSEADEELKDPALRIPLDRFIDLVSKRAVTVVDVRGDDSFNAGHIPGAISIPSGSIESRVEQLRKLANPVVTYCS